MQTVGGAPKGEGSEAAVEEHGASPPAPQTSPSRLPRPVPRGGASSHGRLRRSRDDRSGHLLSVSYTHLTLPTILLV
eukprot:2321184-Pyramimonas_sp.AAC.1